MDPLNQHPPLEKREGVLLEWKSATHIPQLLVVRALAGASSRRGATVGTRRFQKAKNEKSLLFSRGGRASSKDQRKSKAPGVQASVWPLLWRLSWGRALLMWSSVEREIRRSCVELSSQTITSSSLLLDRRSPTHSIPRFDVWANSIHACQHQPSMPSNCDRRGQAGMSALPCSTPHARQKKGGSAAVSCARCGECCCTDDTCLAPSCAVL